MKYGLKLFMMGPMTGPEKAVSGDGATMQENHGCRLAEYRRIIRVSVYLLALTVWIRLPFFFSILINWDESTNILMGQSILDGHLPYTELWDLKPPLAFLFYACAIALLGKSIISVRIAGAFCVALTALLTYGIGRRLLDHRCGLISAMLSVIAISSIHSGQAVMTEHIALVPLVGALGVLGTRESDSWTTFSAGILLALATFVRLNLAYVSVLAGFFIAAGMYLDPRRSLVRWVSSGVAYAAGGCLVFLCVFLPYVAAGLPRLWWDSVIRAPFRYASSQLSFIEAFREQVSFIQELLSSPWSPSFGVSVLVWLGGAAGLIAMASRWRKAAGEKKRGLALVGVFLLGTELSILSGGAANPHYLIQLVPFMSLSAAALLGACLNRRARWFIQTAVLLSCAASLLAVVPEYKMTASRIMAGRPLIHGAACDIADYLKHNSVPGDPIYMMTDHIVYWLIDAEPLSRSTTHPSNIAKEYLLDVLIGPGTSTASELSKVLAVKPRYIVKREQIWYLRTKIPAVGLLEQTIRTHYKHVCSIEGRHIYCRVD